MTTKRRSPRYALGEHRRIPRRDFLQGTLAAAGTALAGSLLAGFPSNALGFADHNELPGDYYPPTLTGMRLPPVER